MTLAGLHVLNTRPAHQASALTRRLQAEGARVTELPLIHIAPLALAPEQQRLLLDLDRYDAVFAVSANAARRGLDAAADYWPQWPHRLPAFAVGERTAQVLRDAGLTVHLPLRPDSEGLLAMRELQQVQGRHFLLFRGEGGRELLVETLRERGAHIDVMELYRRELPAGATTQWQALASGELPQAVILTSPDALRHWRQVAGERALDLCWVVVSPRMRSLAEAAGAQVIEAAAADEDSLLRALASIAAT